MNIPNILECTFCGSLVDEADAHLEYKVWVHGPKKDGATLREPTGRCACSECMSALKAGQPAGQHTLFDN